jgi:NADH-quinone oxidoreductase subunit G
MCFVEVTQEVRGKAQTRLVTGCNTVAADGMTVRTTTDAVKKARNDILEFLLINHPVDCPVCDQAGECKLQDYTFTYGARHSRFGEQKRFRGVKKLGSGVRLYTNRCILCDRCVRFLRDYVGTGELTVKDMGNSSQIATFPGRPINNRMAGNITDLCPVGALLPEDFLFKARVWNLKPMSSVCPGCSRGCNTFLDVKDDEVQRTRPRLNMDVNTWFICDPGRYSYHVLRHPDRLESPAQRDGERLREVAWEPALDALAEKLKNAASDAAVLVSTHLTLEELAEAQKLAEALGTGNLAYIPNAHVEDDEKFPGGFVIEGDKSPNTAGAERAIGRSLGDLGIDGTTPAVLVINSSVDVENIGPANREKIRAARFVAVVDVLRSPLAIEADMALPGRMWAEKRGTFVNSQGRRQELGPAVLGPVQSRDEREIIRELTRRVSAARAAGVAA